MHFYTQQETEMTQVSNEWKAFHVLIIVIGCTCTSFVNNVREDLDHILKNVPVFTEIGL